MATMNDGQRAGFIDLLAFANDPNRKEHRFSGGAGTGKSFFISKVVDDLLKHTGADCTLNEIKITATTNKAAAVLSNAIPHKRTEIGTIYSAMNLRLTEDWKTGEQRVVPTRNWEVHQNTLFIIDEASMVNAKLMDYLMKGTDSTCKILYVGDKNQLAPVKETLSPVYAKNMSESLLTEPVRNAEQPALMELCEQLVDTVKTGKFHPIKETPGVIDFIDGNQLRGILEREYAKEDPTKRILCYTNSKVLAYNEFIREVRGYTQNYNVGEIMSNNASVELTDTARLYTDQLVEIVGRKPNRPDENIVKGYTVEMVDLEVRDVHTGAEFSVTVFNDPNDRQETLKFYAGKKSWERYFNFKNKFPDLRQVAASTTHKAQGSTYESVIVDLGDISDCTNRDQTARMLYVALSRPKMRLYIRGELAERYFE